MVVLLTVSGVEYRRLAAVGGVVDVSAGVAGDVDDKRSAVIEAMRLRELGLCRSGCGQECGYENRREASHFIVWCVLFKGDFLDHLTRVDDGECEDVV